MYEEWENNFLQYMAPHDPEFFFMASEFWMRVAAVGGTPTTPLAMAPKYGESILVRQLKSPGAIRGSGIPCKSFRDHQVPWYCRAGAGAVFRQCDGSRVELAPCPHRVVRERVVRAGHPRPAAAHCRREPSDPSQLLRARRNLEPTTADRARSESRSAGRHRARTPPPPGFGGPAVFPGGPASGPVSGPVGLGVNEEAYNSGVVVNNADLGGFWARTGDKFKRCWSDMSGAMESSVGGRARFQSDHCFDSFISPVSNPVYFEDPRTLTELRPIFIWQRRAQREPGLRRRRQLLRDAPGPAGIHRAFSLVVNKLGWTWINPDGNVLGIDDGSGFSELHLGPKFTFIRNENTGTVGALGLNFEIAAGSEDALQHTGNWSMSPYFSIAQNFWRTGYGSLNFMNTTGYSVSIDSKRSDFLYSSFHLDYNILNAGKLYPLVEINWTRYTMNGSALPLDFEGTNLFNFGSMAVAGHSDLTMALGFRYKFNECVQFGLAGEFSLIGGHRHMEGFRIGADMIFRY